MFFPIHPITLPWFLLQITLKSKGMKGQIIQLALLLSVHQWTEQTEFKYLGETVHFNDMDEVTVVWGDIGASSPL